MSHPSFAINPRSAFGRKAADAVRHAGGVPLTICRHGQDSTHHQVAEKDGAKLAPLKSQVVELDQAGAKELVLIKDVSIHPVTDRILHIDALAVTDDRVVAVDVPVKALADECPGIKAGGILEQMARKVRIRCRAGDIPPALIADLVNTQLTETFYASALTLPKGAKLVTHAKTAVISIIKTRGQKRSDAGVEEGAAAPAAAAGAAKPADGAAAPADGAKPAAAPKGGKK